LSASSLEYQSAMWLIPVPLLQTWTKSRGQRALEAGFGAHLDNAVKPEKLLDHLAPAAMA